MLVLYISYIRVISHSDYIYDFLFSRQRGHLWGVTWATWLQSNFSGHWDICTCLCGTKDILNETSGEFPAVFVCLNLTKLMSKMSNWNGKENQYKNKRKCRFQHIPGLPMMLLALCWLNICTELFCNLLDMLIQNTFAKYLLVMYSICFQTMCNTGNKSGIHFFIDLLRKPTQENVNYWKSEHLIGADNGTHSHFRCSIQILTICNPQAEFLVAYCKPWIRNREVTTEDVLKTVKANSENGSSFPPTADRLHHLIQQDVRSVQGHAGELCRQKHPVLACGTLLLLVISLCPVQNSNLCLSVSDTITTYEEVFFDLQAVLEEKSAPTTQGFFPPAGIHALCLQRCLTFTVG